MSIYRKDHWIYDEYNIIICLQQLLNTKRIKNII